MPEGTVAASAVHALLEFAVSRGADRAALRDRARLTPDELVDRDSRVALHKYVALMRAAKLLCNAPALALHFGETVDMSEISIGASVGGVTSVDDMLAQINRYASLAIEIETVGKGDRFQLQRRQGQLWMVDARRNPSEFVELSESSFARMICSTRRALGDNQLCKAIHFTHAEPSYGAEYSRVFRVPVVFGSTMNALQLDEPLFLKMRPPATSEYLSVILREHAEALLAKLEGAQSMQGRVKRVLTALLPTGTASADATAASLGLSRQTLFRRLKAEGTSYEAVLSELRYKLSLHHLDDERLSVKRTARLVGFSDATAFSRAFKRWTGASPRVRIARVRPPL